MLTTKNYKLKKPELTDSPPDITVMNPNWDLVDEKLFAVIQAWEEFKKNGGEIGGVLKANFGSLKSTNGWKNIGDGMIMQWGKVNIDSGKLQVITYPISFPNTTLTVSIVEGENSGGVNYGTYKVDGTRPQSFNLWRNGGGTMYVYWLAIGY